jgi:hypothetical protein
MEKILKIHAQHKVQFEMKRTHGNEDKWKVVIPRPDVDVRKVINCLTSPDCTTAHPGVTKDTCGEMKRTHGNEEKWKLLVPTIPREKNKLLLAAGLKGCIGINNYYYFFKSRTMTGLRTRILHHVVHSKCSGKPQRNKAKIKHSKQQKLESIPRYELKSVKKMDTNNNKKTLWEFMIPQT